MGYHLHPHVTSPQHAVALPTVRMLGGLGASRAPSPATKLALILRLLDCHRAAVLASSRHSLLVVRSPASHLRKSSCAVAARLAEIFAASG